MPSIFPEDYAGGLVIRDVDGVPTNPAGVQNAYAPSAAFLSNCLLTALPSDCTARIEAKQINAIVSELLAFAECMDPDGPWDCNSLSNLCAAFTAFLDNYVSTIAISDAPPAGAEHGQLWWSSATGLLSIYYDDGTSAQWVQITTVVDGVSIIGAGTFANPYHVGLVDGGSF